MSLKPMKTYVAFIVPSPAAPEKGVAVPMPVESRDLDKLAIPARACGFYFYDAAADITDTAETLLWQENSSKVYLLANTMLNRKDVKELIGGDSNSTMQWDPRVEAHDRFVVTRNNAIQQVTERHIVINSDNKQLWPLHKVDNDHTPRTRMEDIFNPVLQKDIAVKKPLKLKPRTPKPPGM